MSLKFTQSRFTVLTIYWRFLLGSYSCFCLPETHCDACYNQFCWFIRNDSEKCLLRTQLCIILGWLSLHLCCFCHFRSGRNFSVKKSFTLLPQPVKDVLLVLRMSSVYARCKSPMFEFSEFTICSALQYTTVKVKKFYDFDSQVNGECHLIITRSPTFNLSGDLVILCKGISLTQGQGDLFHLLDNEWLVKVVFLGAVSWSLLKRRKNGLSLESMPGRTLKIKKARVKVVGYLPSLIYYGCVSSHRLLEKNETFPKYHCIVVG